MLLIHSQVQWTTLSDIDATVVVSKLRDRHTEGKMPAVLDWLTNGRSERWDGKSGYRMAHWKGDAVLALGVRKLVFAPGAA